MNFWRKLTKPIVGLSPMDGVTDAAMRYMTAKYGKPAVVFTEFVSAEAIQRVVDGRIKDAAFVMNDLIYSEIERPIVAQLFGKDPEAFYVATKKVVGLGFDGVDINMGCPSKNVAQHGSGAALIENRPLTRAIIKAVKRAVAESGKEVPVSVKTRIGTSEADPGWWEFLAGQNLDAVTMHGRTYRQLYTGKADWKALSQAAKAIRTPQTLFLGNGDIQSVAEAREAAGEYGLDGVLIGRAAQGNPWLFAQREADTKERLAVALEHAQKYEELFPNDHFLDMRKHLAWYAHGFDGASELRQKLVATNSAAEVEKVLKLV